MEIERDWEEAKDSEIIKYINDNYRPYLEEELPEIESRVYKLLRVHYLDSGKILTQVHSLFGRLNNLLELLLVKKRMLIFPYILDYERQPSEDLLNKLLKEIDQIDREYNEVLEILRELRKVTNDYVVPPSGCPTFDTSYEKLESLESTLLKNIHLEREIMYNSF